MNKRIFKLEELNLPLDDLLLENDELQVIKGGAEISLYGSGCGCSCSNGQGCGCPNGQGCGCNCKCGGGGATQV